MEENGKKTSSLKNRELKHRVTGNLSYPEEVIMKINALFSPAVPYRCVENAFEIPSFYSIQKFFKQNDPFLF
jgi:hypothetical protein